MSSYEKQWQNALKDVSILPSAALWENIEAELNSSGGKSAWLTILLIAATITIAFAFPLTIGDSSFEARPQDYKFEAKLENKRDINIPEKESTNQLAKINQLSILPVTDKSDPLLNKEGQDDGQVGIEKSQPEDFRLATVRGLDITDLDMAVAVPGNSLDDYYFIPFYIPEGNSENRGVLASVNMGTGSSSAGSGFSGFGAFASADMNSVAELTDANSDTRTEDSGNTYYFGAGVEMPLGKRWSFVAGLGYLAQTATGSSNIVYDNGSGYQPVGAYDPIIPGTVFLSEGYNYSVTNSYINVPLTVKYPIINRQVKLRIGAGFSTDFMIGHTINSEVYGKASYNPASMDYKPVVFAGLLNADISYSINSQYSVALETGLRKGITSIDESKDYYPSSFTMGLMLLYRLQ